MENQKKKKGKKIVGKSKEGSDINISIETGSFANNFKQVVIFVITLKNRIFGIISSIIFIFVNFEFRFQK